MSFSSTISQLLITVALPLILGQLTRFYVKTSPGKLGLDSFKNVGSCLLLFIIYTTFCETFSQNNLNLNYLTLIFTIFLVGAIQGFLLIFIFWFTSRQVLVIAPRDVVALIFCATHKSLTLGIPMMKLLFSDYPHLSTISIPLLIYHPLQIVIGSFLVEPLRKWVVNKERRFQPKFLASI